MAKSLWFTGTFSAQRCWLLKHRLSTSPPRASLVMPLLNSFGRSGTWSYKWVTSVCMQQGPTTRSHCNRASPTAFRQPVTIPVKFIYQYWQHPHHSHYDQCCKKCFGSLRKSSAFIQFLSWTFHVVRDKGRQKSQIKHHISNLPINSNVIVWQDLCIVDRERNKAGSYSTEWW